MPRSTGLPGTYSFTRPRIDSPRGRALRQRGGVTAGWRRAAGAWLLLLLLLLALLVAALLGLQLAAALGVEGGAVVGGVHRIGHGAHRRPFAAA